MKMTVSEKTKITDSKFEQNKTQYDLDRETADFCLIIWKS